MHCVETKHLAYLKRMEELGVTEGNLPPSEKNTCFRFFFLVLDFHKDLLPPSQHALFRRHINECLSCTRLLSQLGAAGDTISVKKKTDSSLSCIPSTTEFFSELGLFYGVGKSLWPLVSKRSIVQLDLCGANRVCRGDIVVYVNEGRLIGHRVLFERFHLGIRWLFLRGNNLQNIDGWIPEYRIIGKVTEVNRKSLSKGRNVLIQRLLFAHALIQLRVYFLLGDSLPIRWIECRFPHLLKRRHLFQLFELASAPWMMLR